jgi:nucleotide-binding universal stress UspA family protein
MERGMRFAPSDGNSPGEPAMQLAFKTILVPTDFGEAAQLALDYAQVMAKRFDAGLRVLHVVETPLPLATELSAPDLGRAGELAMQNAQRGLAEVIKALPDGNVIGQLVVGTPLTKSSRTRRNTTWISS